jgi:inorganic phosphate transporter, PiT family
VRWRLAQSIVWAWVLTIPAAAGVAAMVWLLLRLIPS